MPRVFISYRRKDSATLATLLAKELERRRIQVFVDTRSIDGGGPFPDRLRGAIADCDVFVCLLGATTLDSDWVREEISHAHNLSKVLIPVFQETYVKPDPVPNDSVRALLQSDGIHILDIKNLFVDQAITDLARMIHGSVPRRFPPAVYISITLLVIMAGMIGLFATQPPATPSINATPALTLSLTSSGEPFLVTCQQTEDKPLVLVTHFGGPSQTPDISERIYNSIVQVIGTQYVTICLDRSVSPTTDALAKLLADHYRAAIVLWGYPGDDNTVEWFWKLSADIQPDRIPDISPLLNRSSDLPAATDRINLLLGIVLGRLLLFENVSDSTAAISVLEKVLENLQHPLEDDGGANALGWFSLGQMYSTNSTTPNFAQALAAYDRAIELNPVYYGAYLNRAYIYERRKDWDNAAADYLFLAHNAPDHSGYAYLKVIQHYQAVGEVDAANQLIDVAITQFDEARLDQPYDAGRYHDLARLQLVKGDITAAVATYTQMLKVVPALDTDTLDDFISDLEELAYMFPAASDSANTLIELLMTD